MKEKIRKVFPFVYKLAILIAISSLYTFLFSDFFEVYDPAWYVVCATFLTVIWLKKALRQNNVHATGNSRYI
ncbi:MAG: hypothetical protein M3M85_02285 [bacterium]|nr:hypothetical protein [bacterium]